MPNRTKHKSKLFYCEFDYQGAGWHLIVRAKTKQAAKRYFCSWIIKRNPQLTGILDYKLVKARQPMYAIAR